MTTIRGRLLFKEWNLYEEIWYVCWAQIMDLRNPSCAAQTMDLFFVQAIHGFCVHELSIFFIYIFIYIFFILLICACAWLA